MTKLNTSINTLSKLPGLKKLYRNFFRKDLIRLEEETFSELINLSKLGIDEQLKKQNEKLLDLLQFANKTCPYYKELFTKNHISVNGIKSFKRIPFLTKSLIKENFDKIISVEAKKTELRKSNTGGSTGEPLEFYTDQRSISIDNAHHKFVYNLMGYKKGDIIIDSGGIKLSPNLISKNIYWVKYPSYSIWGNWGFSALYLNNENIHFYINQILNLKPSIVRGYPSFLNELAQNILKNNISLDFKVKGINLTAEYCSEEQRISIEKAFSSKVYLEYGQGEKTVFCYSNGISYELISSPIYGYVEVIKENGEEALDGDEGEIIVTSLCNFSMPFIRYKTGDRAKVSTKKEGIVKFEKILGRAQDYIVDKHDRKVYITALIFGQHFEAFKKIKQWQIVQHKIGFIEMNIIKDEDFSQHDEDEIFEKIQSTAEVKIKFNYVNIIQPSKSGKKLFVIQNYIL